MRLYGFEHKRTEAQFETAWNELQAAIPKAGDQGFLLGVSGQKLLLDGIPLESGQAERSFAQLLTTAGLASINFSNQVTVEDFARLVRAFAVGGSKGQDVAKQIKDSLGDGRGTSIRINEVKFVAADPATGEVTIAAQIAAQTLGPEFKQWLNDPQKLLQLIAAAEGAKGGGGGEPGGAPMGSVPTVKIQGGRGGSGTGGGGWDGKTVPLQEEEVVQAIRLLTRFGEVSTNPNVALKIFRKNLARLIRTRGSICSNCSKILPAMFRQTMTRRF